MSRGSQIHALLDAGFSQELQNLPGRDSHAERAPVSIVGPIKILAIPKSVSSLVSEYRRKVQGRDPVLAEILCQHIECRVFSGLGEPFNERVVYVEFVRNHENHHFVAGSSDSSLEPDEVIRRAGAYLAEFLEFRAEKSHLPAVAELRQD